MTDTIYLTVGDKVKRKTTQEAGTIISIIDEQQAVVDFFDGEESIVSSDVEVFKPTDNPCLKPSQVLFKTPEKQKTKPKTAETLFDFQNRKNKFSYEIDLHAEQLFANHDTKDYRELLPLQISRLRNFLSQAVTLRVQRVYVIHGVGSGRLKSEVSSVLNQMPEVTQYKNEYHPKYGMGATEVHFR